MKKSLFLFFPAVFLTACTQNFYGADPETTGTIEQEAAPYQVTLIDDFTSTDGNAVESSMATYAEPINEDEMEAEIENMIQEYSPFGLTLDKEKDQWYLDGEPIKRLKDVLLSNGEDMTSGKFQGVIRNLNCKDGDTIVEVIRNFDRVNENGYGMIEEIRVWSNGEMKVIGNRS